MTLFTDIVATYKYKNKMAIENTFKSIKVDKQII